MTTSTTAELGMLRLAVERLLRVRNFCPVVLLTHYRGGFLHLADEESVPPFVREVASLCRCVEDAGWRFPSSEFRRIVAFKRTNVRTCWLLSPTFKFPASPLTAITHPGD